MRTSQEYMSRAPALCIVLMMIVHNLNGNPQSGRHTYVVRYQHGNSLIPVTVVLDYKRQTEYVINMNSRSPAKSMTLYDFKERVIAYKDLKNGECFLGRLTHQTIHEEDAVLKRLKSPVENQPLILTLEPDRPSLTPTEVRNMAGHKAAVFCRRMNTWTLMPEKENRRKRRDTFRHLPRSSSTSENLQKPNHAPSQLSEVIKSEPDNTHRNRSLRDISSFQNNGSFSVNHPLILNPEPASSPQRSIPHSSAERQGRSNVYPFILPRQGSFTDNQAERRSSRQEYIVNNHTRKTGDDSIQLFGFAHKSPDAHVLSKFSQSWSSGPGNGTSLTSSAKNSFIPLKTNNPVVIPNANFPSKSPGSHGTNHIDSTSILPVPSIHPQDVSNFQTLHNRGEILHSYPPFHQLPPEAFVLPLTRSSSATTEQSFAFNNHLGYEIGHPGSPSVYNNTDLVTGLNESLNKSVNDFENASPDQSPLHLLPSPLNNLKNEVSSGISGVPFSFHDTRSKENSVPVFTGKHLNQPTERKGFPIDTYTKQEHVISPDKSSNETEKGHNETITSSFNRSGYLDSSTDHKDSPIPIPRWYPEITKQISIPLEIEILHHHQEEYAHGVTNRTEQVHSIQGHEIEDLLSLPNVNTIIPIPIEAHSNGLRFANDVKLLPQVSDISEDDSPKKTISQSLGSQAERKPETIQFTENRYPIHRDMDNISAQAIFPHMKPTPGPVLTNDTEVIDAVPVPAVQQSFVNRIVHPVSPRTGVAEDGRQIPKRQHHDNGGSLAVQDFKIDEGVPSYRKRFPAVSQVLTPKESVTEADSGRLPGRRLRLNQQGSHVRRRPSAIRNKTHIIPPRGYDSKSAWRKHTLEPHSLINQQQAGLSDQGITFHHRGYAKPGVQGIPYDHHRKRQGLLPPGVSVHPRHPQAPYADLATEAIDKRIPVNPLLHSRPRRIHLRHHRRHQRKRNRIQPSPDSGLPAASCCGGDGQNCCSGRRRGRPFSNGGCCSQKRENRRRNLPAPPPETVKNEVTSRKKVEEVVEDRCMKEKMCRTVYQSTKKVLVCRNIEVDGC